MNQGEFEVILTDERKFIEGDIDWKDDEFKGPVAEFRVELQSSMGYPLIVKGSFNRRLKKISFSIFHPSVGRIYGLDMGLSHKNPDGSVVGDTHKHRWSELFKDKQAYVPKDITASPDEPIEVWKQFCLESGITHQGAMHTPPPLQLDLLP